MKFELPILEERFDIKTKEVHSKKTYIDCKLDMSINAQTRWEENFPELSKTMGVFDYVDKFKNIKITDVATLGIALKLLYCFIDIDVTYKDFISMFSGENEEYFNELWTTIKSVLEFVIERNNSKKKY